MDTPIGQTQSKTRAAHQKTLRGKEGFEMKTAMGMEKVKVWISENLGTKIATRLFRGLALGVLLVTATGIYFSINPGEAGSPLVREHTEVNLEINTAGQHNASFPLSAAEIEGWPEYTLAGRSGHLAVRPLVSEQIELIKDYDMVGILWRINGQGKVVEVPIDGVLFDLSRVEFYPEAE